MCISPIKLGDGTQVACRKCWQCNYVRVDDLVGRCIAESRTAIKSHVVTLTYGRDQSTDSVSYGEAEHERAVLLTYSDVQKFLKRLRNHGYPARYLVSGEYGSAKGRAHWHMVLFWTDKVPPIPALRENAMFEHWTHGFTYWDEANPASFRYALKYVLKETGQGASEAQYKKQQSRMPPLGAEYFAQLARRHAEQGLAPQANTTPPEGDDDGWSIGKYAYSFPEAVRKNGKKKIQFHLSDRSEELFLEAFVKAWREIHGDKPIPPSKLVEEYLDPGVWKRANWNDEPTNRPVTEDGQIDWKHPLNSALPNWAALPVKRTDEQIEVGPGKYGKPFVVIDGQAWFWVKHKGKEQWLKGTVERNATGRKILRTTIGRP